MAKKKQPPMSAHTLALLHRNITDQVTAMIERCGQLRDEGKFDQARALLDRIERLNEELKQVEKARSQGQLAVPAARHR